MSLFNSESKNKLLKANTCYVLGMLATNEEYYPNAGEDQAPVTGMKGSNSIIFYIKALSPEPVPIKEMLPQIMQSDLYSGIDTNPNNQVLFSMDYRMTTDVERKKKMLRDKFGNKLILFKPKISFNVRDGKELVYKNLDVVAIEDIQADPKASYVPIPHQCMNNVDFEKKLTSKSNILFEDYGHAMPDPEYILCGDYIYYNFPSWQRHKTNSNIWACEKGMGKIYRTKFTNYENTIGTDGVIFMERNAIKKLISEAQGEDIEAIPLPTAVHPVAQAIAETIISPAIDNISASSAPESISEYLFLKALKQCTIREKLCYDTNDLVNFHTCVKTNPITILAGMSGTGKTQLALAYSKMLDLSEEDTTLLFLPISPSYTEPGDLLGYLNNSSGLFVPSEIGFTDFLIHASDNPDKMHMVIFDEMNLSQVEYWFAPFISLLEKKEDKRFIQLYSNRAHCINNERYKSSIPIGSNIIFIGTVNVDETTKDFSDRLLDRANIVVLNKKNFAQLREEQEAEKTLEKTFEKYVCSSYDEYNSWVQLEDSLSAYSLDEINLLDELHSLIRKFDVQKGVSFRILKKIGDYLNNIPVDDKGQKMISREDAFDIEIKQRLITKIKGTEKQFETLIGTIRDDSDIPTNSMLYTFFNNEKSQGISHFTLTKQEIIRKAKELGIYGYAS